MHVAFFIVSVMKSNLYNTSIVCAMYLLSEVSIHISSPAAIHSPGPDHSPLSASPTVDLVIVAIY